MRGTPGRCAILACVALATVLRTSVAAQQPPPNVIVVLVDTLRADRLGVYGNRNGLTPYLDDLARRGTVFSNAYAASSWTCPSVASLFTSRYPSQHQVTNLDARVSDSEVTLAERLQQARYRTLGFVANLRLTEQLGYGQGFERWNAYMSATKLRADRLRRRLLSSPEMAAARGAQAPLFLYVHYMEPHAPYNVPPRYRKKFERRADPSIDSAAAVQKVLDLNFGALSGAELDHVTSLYDAEVAFLDDELRRLMAGLEARGLLEHSIVVVTADHGEELGEHQLIGHGTSLYNQELRVPLIVIGQGVPAGRVVHEPVSLMDVAPSLLALTGEPAEPRFQGRSLVPLLQGRAASVDVVAELVQASTTFDPRRHSSAIVRGNHKLLTISGNWRTVADAELYDLAADPAETKPVGYVGGPRQLPSGSPDLALAQDLVRALQETQTRLASSVTPQERAPVDEKMRERLRGLGYAN
jgi:arylsulfatase A-like enzyme